MTRGFFSLAAALLVFVASPASALRVKFMTTSDLVAASALIVRGTVAESRAVWRPDGVASTPGAPRADIVTDATVVVTETLLGRAPGRTVTVRQLGGVVGADELQVAGVRYLRPGEDVLLFLRTDGQRHYLVGFAQGSLFLEQSAGVTYLRRDTSALELVVSRHDATAKRGKESPRPTEAPAEREPLAPLRAQILSLASERHP